MAIYIKVKKNPGIAAGNVLNIFKGCLIFT